MKILTKNLNGSPVVIETDLFALFTPGTEIGTVDLLLPSGVVVKMKEPWATFSALANALPHTGGPVPEGAPRPLLFRKD